MDEDRYEKEAKALCSPEIFHELYEKYAPFFGYETRTETREFDRKSKNGQLMVRVCSAIAADVAAKLREGAKRETKLREKIAILKMQLSYRGKQLEELQAKLVDVKN